MSELDPECAPKRISADHFEFMGSRPEPSPRLFELGTASLSDPCVRGILLVASLLNLREGPVTHSKGLWESE